MSFTSAYLTPRMKRIWSLRLVGNSQAEIGRRLGVTRQGINEALRIIDGKLHKAFREAARSNRLEVRGIDPVNGVLEAYSHAYKVPVVVSFSEGNGVQVWYLYEGHCQACEQREVCTNMLRAEAEERGIKLSDEDLNLEPTQLGMKIFSSYLKKGGDSEFDAER